MINTQNGAVIPPIRQAFGRDVPKIHIYDIGARTEGTDRYAALLEQAVAEVIGFEANPAEFEILQKENNPLKRYLPYFLGKGGPGTFYITRFPGCSSLYEPDPAVIELFTGMGATYPDGNFGVERTISVETRRLDDIPELPPCDYMKVDVQGGELDVLECATAALEQCVVLEVEVEFLRLYKKQPLFGDVQKFLGGGIGKGGRNFVLHKFIDVSGRSLRPLQMGLTRSQPMSQILWADAIFVRDFTKLDLWSDEQLLKGAAILYGTYYSYDLAHFLLTEYDRRHGSQIVTQFMETLTAMRSVPVLFLNTKLR